MKKVDLIIKGTLVPMVTESSLADGALAVHEGVIVALGTADEILSGYSSEQILDAGGKLVMPGFINGHTHVGMTLLRGVADKAKNVHEWLKNYIFPLEKKLLNEDFVYWSTLLACYEMIQSGITTFADMYFFENAAAQAVHVAGMRAILGETIFIERDVEHAAEFCRSLKDNKLVRPAFAPHSLYSCDASTLVAAHTQAELHNVPLIIHVAEHKDEVLQLQKDKGMGLAEYMRSLGLLCPSTIIAHGVNFSEEDLAIIANTGASIIYNPTSNMKLASGIARVKSMLEYGISVGLGTDGAASNNALNSFMEMKTGALLQDLCLEDYCKPLTPFEVVKLATSNGARALNKQNRIGTLEVGKRADIIFVDNQQLHQLPMDNIFSQIVYSSNSCDVQTVIIDGKIVMQDRKMLTLQEYVPELRERITFYEHKIMSRNF